MEIVVFGITGLIIWLVYTGIRDQIKYTENPRGKGAVIFDKYSQNAHLNREKLFEDIDVRLFEADFTDLEIGTTTGGKMVIQTAKDTWFVPVYQIETSQEGSYFTVRVSTKYYSEKISTSERETNARMEAQGGHGSMVTKNNIVRDCILKTCEEFLAGKQEEKGMRRLPGS